MAASRDLRAEALADPTLPAAVRRALESGLRLERITLDAEGRFLHEGEPIQHERILDLFRRSIERTPGGTFVLRVPPYTYPIEVEDAPLFVRTVELTDGAEPGVKLILSDDSEEPLVPASLRYVPGRGFYCRVKGDRYWARFTRPAYYALAEHVQPGPDGIDRLVLGTTATPVPTLAESPAASRQPGGGA